MSHNTGLHRRRFIRIASLSVFSLLTGGALQITEKNRTFLRPPGSLNESTFLSRCIKCQRCLQVCPSRVIVPISLNDSIRSVSTPTLNFKHGYCDLCMECMSVCPTGAIQPMNKEDIKLGNAVVIKEACIAWDWGGCTKCAAECPENAIQLDNEKRPVIDQNKCNGCGLCEFICPSSSLRAYNANIKSKGIVVQPLNHRSA